MSVRAGTRLDGRYLLSERIAVGGMGEVWAGVDQVLGRHVAVKVLRAELAEDQAFRKRFRAEARTAGGLPHNGIAAVFDYGETTVGPDGHSPAADAVQGDGIAYLVMELVPGEPLSAILSRESPLPVPRAMNLVAQSARALHAAHQRGVIHRDVKPANLMVTPEGRVKVTDFGIARPTDHEPLTMTGQVMGTAHYLAPELARGEDASPLSDVYALGVVLYESIAGRRPFEGENQVLVATAHISQEPPPLPSTVPAEVAVIVAQAMQKEPSQRIASAEAFAVDLERLLGAPRSGAPAQPKPIPEAPGQTASRNVGTNGDWVGAAPAVGVGAAAAAVAGARAVGAPPQEPAIRPRQVSPTPGYDGGYRPSPQAVGSAGPPRTEVSPAVGQGRRSTDVFPGPAGAGDVYRGRAYDDGDDGSDGGRRRIWWGLAAVLGVAALIALFTVVSSVFGPKDNNSGPITVTTTPAGVGPSAPDLLGSGGSPTGSLSSATTAATGTTNNNSTRPTNVRPPSRSPSVVVPPGGGTSLPNPSTGGGGGGGGGSVPNTSTKPPSTAASPTPTKSPSAASPTREPTPTPPSTASVPSPSRATPSPPSTVEPN